MLKAASAQDGFSLLELLVAIAILSLAVIPMMATQSTAIRSSSHLNEKEIARFVAENALTELSISEIPPEPGMRQGTENQAGFDYTWQAVISRIPNQPLMTIMLSVNREGSTDTLYRLNGFRKVK
ncbi:MAG: type II secretion system minor pseudopilin GspI [Kordiimonadaceae bacterium]|nr:type II secretion system minor pseudopilin GspI [Kordiimonadaceae bacterium]